MADQVFNDGSRTLELDAAERPVSPSRRRGVREGVPAGPRLMAEDQLEYPALARADRLEASLS